MTAPDKIWAYSYDVNTSQGPLDVWKTINTWSDATVQPIIAVEYTRTDLAQAAVAAAYEAAAQVCANHAVIAARTNQDQANSLLRSSESGIRALATPDQLAVLTIKRNNLDAALVVLQDIADWKMPETGKFWPDSEGRDTSTKMSYAACYGSSGERAYIRGKARAFLQQLNGSPAKGK